MTREEQVQYICEKLMEDPEFRKAFVGAITDAVNLVVKAIKVLEQEPCEELDFVQPHKKVSVNLEPCDDCISRQAVLDLPKNTERNFYGKIIEQSINIEYIKALPPVTPAEKVGQWIKSRDSYGNNHFTCPFCEHDIATKYDGAWEDNYCSNCGAKMQEVEE